MEGLELNSRRSAGGFTLIEALIAALILALGLLALARLQSALIGSSAQARAHSEAVHLAQGALEELRNGIVEGDYTAIGDTEGGWGAAEPLAGVNAHFSRRRRVTDRSGPERKEVEVEVSWSDPHDGPQVVSLTTTLAWLDPASGVTTGAALPFPLPGTPDKRYDALPPGAVDNGDGTHTLDPDAGGTQLIDSLSGEVLIALEEGEALVHLEGTVYVDTRSVDPNEVAVEATGYAHCTLQYGAVLARDSETFQSLAYRCYLPEGWYGGVGVLDRGSTGTRDASPTVCVGDPYAVTSGPARSREYRGYGEDGSSTGITERLLGRLEGRHDFLVIATRDDCTDRMVAGDPAGGDDSLFFFLGNLPAPVCLTPAIHCPAPEPAVSLSGRFIPVGALRTWTIERVEAPGPDTADCRHNDYAYRCDVAELSDGGWNGDIEFEANRIFCDSYAKSLAIAYSGITEPVRREHRLARRGSECP